MITSGTFRQLVRHFFGRFFDKESLSPQGEPEASIFQTLGLLAPPGAFVSLFTMIFQPARWQLVTLRFLFICYSMVAIGVVMVFEWDALLPDKRDYQVLTPLPLRPLTMFLAKIAALAIFLAAFLAAINFFGVMFWPGVERQGGFFSIAGAHLLAVSAAGLFSAVAIAAVQGILVTIFRGALYRRVSIFTQTAVMALLIMFLFLSPLMGGRIGVLCSTNSPYLRWFPGFWFTGWYEQLRPVVGGRHAGMVLAGLGPLAPRGMWAAFALFVLTFLPGYRSHARRILEAPEPSPKGPGRIRRAIDAAANRLLGDPVESGVFHFIGQTIARSLKHRLFLATYGGFGAALVVITLAHPGNWRRVPFMLSFILISGLRAAFNFPSDLRANWAFQVSETSSAAHYIRTARKWVMVYAVLPLFLLMAAMEMVRSPGPAVVYHFAFGLVVSFALTETMFVGFQKVPFTCAHFPAKFNLVFLAILYVFGFTFYSGYMADVQDWLWSMPAAAAAFFIAAGGAAFAWSRVRSRTPGEASLEFEDDGNPVVTTLGITE